VLYDRLGSLTVPSLAAGLAYARHIPLYVADSLPIRLDFRPVDISLAAFAVDRDRIAAPHQKRT